MNSKNKNKRNLQFDLKLEHSSSKSQLALASTGFDPVQLSHDCEWQIYTETETEQLAALSVPHHLPSSRAGSTTTAAGRRRDSSMIDTLVQHLLEEIAMDGQAGKSSTFCTIAAPSRSPHPRARAGAVRVRPFRASHTALSTRLHDPSAPSLTSPTHTRLHFHPLDDAPLLPFVRLRLPSVIFVR